MHLCAMYAYTCTGVSGISICTHRCMFQHLSPSLVPVAGFYREETAPKHIHGHSSQLPAMIPSLPGPATNCCQELLHLSLGGDSGALGALSLKVHVSKATVGN